ncbi:MAG: hypothetical protein ACREQJ_15620 [Candidatus Binatia bacterium]
MILALNETRKTLIASGLERSRERTSKTAVHERAIAGGGGVWIEDCRQIDATGMTSAVDVIFLDAGSRVIEGSSEIRPGTKMLEVEGAVAALALPSGTNRFSQTEPGDRILVETVGAELPRASSVGRRSRLL